MCGVRRAHITLAELQLANDFIVFVPETRNVLLEEMDTKFGGSNHVEKGGQIMGLEDSHHVDIDADTKMAHAEHVQDVKSSS